MSRRASAEQIDLFVAPAPAPAQAAFPAPAVAGRPLPHHDDEGRRLPATNYWINTSSEPVTFKLDHGGPVRYSVVPGDYVYVNPKFHAAMPPALRPAPDVFAKGGPFSRMLLGSLIAAGLLPPESSMSEKPDKPAHAAAIRRDRRNVKAPDGASTGAVRKDRKHCCGGKVGRLHTPVCMTYSEAKPGSALGTMESVKDWRILVCSTCGKEIAHYFPIRWRRIDGKPADGFETKPKPEWVTS